MSIPHKIHALWFQGEQNAPPLVRKCLQRWRNLNPEYQVEIYDRARVTDLLPSFPFDLNKLRDQALSDIFRIHILNTVGGIWADATVFPTAPLSQWLDQDGSTGFFAFPGHRSPLDVSSWLLASEPNHLLIQAWWDKIPRYWTHPRTLISYRKEDGGFMANYKQDPLRFFNSVRCNSTHYPYYWVMYMFTDLLTHNPAALSAWNAVPKRDAHAAHSVFFGLRDTPDMPEHEIQAAFNNEIVQKLSWRDSVLAQRCLSLSVFQNITLGSPI